MKKCLWEPKSTVKNKQELGKANIKIAPLAMKVGKDNIIQELANRYANHILNNFDFSDSNKLDVIDTAVDFISSDGFFKLAKLDASDLKTKLTAALKDIKEAESVDPTIMEGDSNIETMSSVYEKPVNREQNLLFLDYAFRGMNLPRQKFVKKFRSLIWESCFIGRGSLDKFYPGAHGFIGQVETKTQLNNNIKDLQESLYETLVDHYNSMYPAIKINSQKLYKIERINGRDVRVPTYDFLLHFKEFDNYFKKYSTDYILKQSTTLDIEPEGSPKYDLAKSFMDAYEAFVLLNNFDSYITTLFGDDMEILPQNVYMYNGGIKYQLADKSKSNKTTHAEIEEIKVDKLVNYMVKGGIESTPEYDFNAKENTANLKPNHYLNYADFATIMGDIKSLSLHDAAYQDITEINGALDGLSDRARAYVEKHRTLRGCLAAMKLDPIHNISYIMELLNTSSFYELDVFSNMMKDVFPKEKRDKLYSIYRGIFGNFDESLYKLDVEKRFFGNFTQNAISVYKNNIVQFFIDKNGVTRVRTLSDSDKGNIKYRVESAINNSHTMLDTEASLNVIESKKKIESLSSIAPKFYIPVSNDLRILIECNPASMNTHKYSIQKINNGVFSDVSIPGVAATGNTKSLIRNISKIKDELIKTALTNGLYNFISHELCMQIDPSQSNVLQAYKNVTQYDTGQALDDLLKLSLNTHRNAIIKVKAFNSSSLSYAKQAERLKEIYGENAPEIISKNQISVISLNDIPIFDHLIDAIVRMRNTNLTSTVKSGEGNALSPYSLSRLYGSVNEQAELLCLKLNSAVKNSALLTQPGFFKGTVRSLELYRLFLTGLKATDFNAVDFHYGGFVYQYISGIMGKSTKKEFFGGGTIGTITAVNSDKGDVELGYFDLNRYKLNSGLYAGKTLYLIVSDNTLSTDLKRIALHDALKQEIGPQYKRLSENIETAFNDENKGLIHVLNRYVHEVLHDNTNYFSVPNYAQHLSNFTRTNNEFLALKDKHRNLDTILNFISEATRWYNTKTEEGIREPLALPENTVINYNKDGSLVSNPSLVSLLYRYDPDYTLEKTKNSPNGFNENNYLNFNSFFNYKGGTVAFDLINSRFLLDLSDVLTQVESANSVIRKQNKLNRELIYVKEQLQNIFKQEGVNWIGDDGIMIVAKYTADDGTIYNLTSKTDLYVLSKRLHRNIDEKFFLREATEGRLTLNPLIELFNLIDYLCSTTFTHCTVGTILSHPPKGQMDPNDTLRERILADESFRYLALTKRNVSLTATVESYLLGLRTGIPTRLKIAPIGNIYAKCHNSLGDVARVKIFDGCTHSAAFMAYWENNSLQSARAGLVKKPYGHFFDQRFMTASNLKTAEFPITNENMRRSEVFRHLMKNSSDLTWRNADASIYVSDITTTVDGKNYKEIVGDQYEQIGNKYYKIEITKIEGDNLYRVDKYLCDYYGNQLESTPEFSDERVIDTDYKLWQAFGGYNSCSLNQLGVFVKSEASIKAVADLANEIGTMQDSVKSGENEEDFINVNGKYFYQPLKHAVIHLLPNEEAIKMGACNKNPKTAYYEDYDLNWSYVNATQFGIQLDKEHHADQSELSLMTLVMNACAFRGYTYEVAMDLYRSLLVLNENGCKDFLVPFELMMSDNPAEREKGKQDFLTAVNKHLIKTLANRSGISDMSKLWAQKILDAERAGEKVDYATLKIPYSDKSIYKQVRSSIANILTKLGIKHKIDGNLAVLNPAYDVIKIVGDRLVSDFENFDQEVEAMLAMAQPVFSLNGTQTTIKRILTLVKNSSGVVNSYHQGIRCSVDNIPGNIDVIYNSDDNVYDIVFNIKYSDIDSADLSDVNNLMSTVVNAIPTDGIIRFGYNNKVTKDNLKTYELFRQYGFHDNISEEYDTEDASEIEDYVNAENNKALIPTLSKVTSADRTIDSVTETDDFDRHFEHLDATNKNAVFANNLHSTNANDGITIVLTKNNNSDVANAVRKDILRAPSHAGEIITYTDEDIRDANSSKLIQTIRDAITGYFNSRPKFKHHPRKPETDEIRHVFITGDSISAIRDAGITLAHFNTIMSEVINTLENKDKYVFLSDGLSGFSIASALAARNNKSNWRIRNGGDWVYVERNFELDNREVNERWTNESLKKNNIVTLDEKLNYIKPENAILTTGSFIPEDVYLKALPYLLKKHLEYRERAKEKYESYKKNIEDYKVKLLKYQKDLEEYNKRKEAGEKGVRKPRLPEEPRKPDTYTNLEISPDISGRSILSVFSQLDSAVDENGNRIFTQDELYNKILLPLYKLWAYGHPRKVLNTKKRLLNNILYAKDIVPGVNVAHAIAEIMDDVSFAYNHDTTGLEPISLTSNKNAKEEVKTAQYLIYQLCAISNKYIGYNALDEEGNGSHSNTISAKLAAAQDAEVVNPGIYKKGDIVFAEFFNRVTKLGSDPKLENDAKIIEEISKAINDDAIIALRPTLDAINFLQGRNLFSSDANVGGLHILLVAKSQDLIDAQFIRQLSETVDGGKIDYYIPSTLYYNLRRVNDRIKQSEGSDQNAYRIYDIMSAVRDTNKFKSERALWEKSANGVDPILHTIYINDDKFVLCFGSNKDVLRAQSLYSVIDNINKILSGYKYFDINEDIISQVAAIDPITALMVQDEYEGIKKARTGNQVRNGFNRIKDIIYSIIIDKSKFPSITYLSGGHSVELVMNPLIPSERSKGYRINQNLAFMYNTVKTGDLNIKDIMLSLMDTIYMKELEKADMNELFAYNEQLMKAIAGSVYLIDKSIGNIDHPVQTIVLDGKAGTGKTTVINAILKNVNKSVAKNCNIAVCALSNKAKSVIDSNISKSLKLGNSIYRQYNALTIALLCGFKPDKDGNFSDLQIPRNAPIRFEDIVVIDEASMITTKLYKDIKNAMKPGSILIFLGDKGQLSAIRNEESTPTDHIYANQEGFLFTDPDNHILHLTERIRQGESNPILHFSDQFYDTRGVHLVNLDLKGEFEKITDDGAVSFRTLGTNDINVFRQAILDKDLNRVRIIGYTNRYVDNANIQIHNCLFPETRNMYNPGEFIIVRKNYNSLLNATECVIKSCFPPTTDKETGITTLRLEVKLPDGSILDITVIPEMYLDPESKNKSLEEKTKYENFTNKNHIIDVGLAYAITVYKSLGSTYDIVYMSPSDFVIPRTTNNALSSTEKIAELNKMIYTAATRARNVVAIMGKGFPMSEIDLGEVNDRINSNRVISVNSLTYRNIKDLTLFEQNQDDKTIPVVFNGHDGPYIYDYKKGDTLIDFNNIKYEIVDDPFVYSRFNKDRVDQLFGSDNSFTYGSIVAIVKPVDFVDLNQIKSAGNNSNRHRLVNADLTKINIGKTYFVLPNPEFLYKFGESANYGKYSIIDNKTISNVIQINDDVISINSDLAQLNGFTEKDVQKLIYQETFKDLVPSATDESIDNYVKQKMRDNFSHQEFIETPNEYYDLVGRIKSGKVSSVTENIRAARNLSTINYTFKDIDGNPFLFNDIDSVKHLFELRDVIRLFKNGDKSDACRRLQTLAEVSLGIKYNDITPKNFKDRREEIEEKIRIKQQRDLANLSVNSADLLREFDLMVAEFDGTTTYCQRAVNWINYVEGNTGRLSIDGFGSITPDSFKRDMAKIRNRITKLTKILINGVYRTIDKSTVKCHPYEVVMPKTMAKQFGLRVGDSVYKITSSYESEEYKNATKPSEDLAYLGFFGKRQYDNWKDRINQNSFDICLKKIDGKHVYLAFNDKIDDITKNGYHLEEGRTQVDLYGRLMLLNPDGTSRFEINKDDRIYTDNYGNEIIVTNNPSLYIDNMHYTDIELTDDILSEKNNEKFLKILQAISDDKKANFIKKQIQKEILDKDGNIDENKARKRFHDLLHDKTKLLEKFRRIGQNKYNSFKVMLDVLATRIPAQCQHSFMAMRIVGFVDGDVNNAFVSADLIWLQGSDFDIDTVSLATFSADSNGYIHLWSPYANYSSYKALHDSLRLPFPTRLRYVSKEIFDRYSVFVQPSTPSQVAEWINKYVSRGVIITNQRRNKKNPNLFVINKNAKIDDIIEFLNDKPKILDNSHEARATLQSILDNIGVLDIYSSKIIDIFNSSVLDLYNRHNMYLENKDQDTLRLISNNKDIASMIAVSIDPMNMHESRTPIDSCKDVWLDIAQKSTKTDLEFRLPGSFTTKANGIVENQVGKKCISICAVGLKAQSAIQYYYSKILNGSDKLKQDAVLFFVNIGGKNYHHAADVRSKSPNTLSNKFLALLALASQTNDVILGSSALLSLSVDNAKDLTLAKINALPSTIGMYLYGLTLGVPIETMTNILMGPIGDICIELVQGNNFVDSSKSFKNLGDVLSYLRKNPLNKLEQKYNSRFYNGTRVDASVFNACLLNIYLACTGKESVESIETCRKYVSSLIKDKTEEEVFDLMDEASKFIKDKYKSQPGDYPTKMLQMINDIKDYARYQNVIKENSLAFEDFNTLYSGAREMNKLGRILSLNQGLKSQELQSDNLITTIENIINNGSSVLVDIVKFVTDPIYRDKMIEEYGKSSDTTFNILDVIYLKEDVFGFLKDVAMEIMSSQNSGKYKFAMDNYKKVKDELGLRIPDSDILSGLRRFYDDKILDDFIDSRDIRVTIPAGTTVFDKMDKVTSVSDITIRLGTPWNNASFKSWMDTVVIPALKQKYPGNKFIRDLNVVESNKTVSRNSTYYYTIPTVNLSPREDYELYIFDKYVNEFLALGTESFGGYPIMDLFALYNIIALRRAIGETTFTKLINSCDMKITDDLMSFIADKDVSKDYVIDDVNITSNDILPYVVPMYSQNTLNSTYVRRRNPFTGEYLILKKNPKKYTRGTTFEEDMENPEVEDVMNDILSEDIISELNGSGREKWYGDDYSLVENKVDYSFFLSGKISNSDSARYTDKDGREYTIVYDSNTDEYGNHRLYKVTDYYGKDVKSKLFPYAFVKITKEDLSTKIDFVGKYIMAQDIDKSDMLFEFTEEQTTQPMLINLGKDEKGNNLPKLRLKFSENGKIEDMTILSLNKIKLNPEELDGNAPVWIEGGKLNIATDVLREIYDQKINCE